MSKQDRAAEEREFVLAMQARGIDVPTELRLGSLNVYLELKRMAKMMRQTRSAESEPASGFELRAFVSDARRRP